MLVLARLFENSLIFNGVEFGKFGVIEKIDRPFLTPMNIIEKDINGRDGVLYKTSLFEPLTITILLEEPVKVKIPLIGKTEFKEISLLVKFL